MISNFKRFRSANLSETQLRPKIFQRGQNKQKGEDLYEEGVEQIIKVRKFLELTEQTVLIAIDIYKNFLKVIGSQLREQKVTIYMASIFIAGKLNEIYAPKMEDILDGCENLVTRKKILTMEKIICKLSNFNFQIQNHLSLCFKEILQTENQKVLQACIKNSLKCISDPILMEIDNHLFAKAISQILFPERAKKKKIDKNLVRVIFRLKRKLNVSIMDIKL